MARPMQHPGVFYVCSVAFPEIAIAQVEPGSNARGNAVLLAAAPGLRKALDNLLKHYVAQVAGAEQEPHVIAARAELAVSGGA